MNQKVVELAGAAANGVRGHVGLSADAPIPAIVEFTTKFTERYKYRPDHNGIKGYTAVYLVKYVTEKIGKFDRKAFGATMKGLTLTPGHGAWYSDGGELGPERRYRPRQLPGRNRRRQAEDRGNVAEAETIEGRLIRRPAWSGAEVGERQRLRFQG